MPTLVVGMWIAAPWRLSHGHDKPGAMPTLVVGMWIAAAGRLPHGHDKRGPWHPAPFTGKMPVP